MEEDSTAYAWEIDPNKYLEQNVNEAIIAGTTEPAIASKQQKIALLNELALLSKATKSVLRYSIIVLDLSPQKIEFPLTRKETLLKWVEGYIYNYFEQNPLSQLAVIGMANAKAFVICDFSSSAKDIVSIVRISNNS